MEKNQFNAESQLLKQGWTKGSGLGSKEDGIKEAIKVKLKFDQAGIGHNCGEEFKFHWWDHAFNKAARNIKVNETQNGIKIKSKGKLEVTSTKKALKVNKNQMIYGMFVKSSAVTSEGELKQDKFREGGNADDSGSDSDMNQEDAGTLSKLTDEQLVKICEGRTAHKGARHGLTLSGKLARIAAQENQFEAASAPSERSDSQHPDVISSVVKPSDRNDSSGKRKTYHEENIVSDCRIDESGVDDVTVKKVKKKSKHKTREIEDESISICQRSNSVNEKKKRKKKKSKDKERQDGDEVENGVCVSQKGSLCRNNSEPKKLTSIDLPPSGETSSELSASDKCPEDGQVIQEHRTWKRQIDDVGEHFSKKKKRKTKKHE